MAEDSPTKNKLLYQTLVTVSRDCSREMRAAIERILSAYRGDHELPPAERWR